ncbi:MAG: deoxyguanosinetriphosphate triphosphohydrolase [Deltaproteobacteria bacterium]|nr:deoxyguanosinetriphosphate triphosphohydrolase [Deltaproteobacteria bacterium]
MKEGAGAERADLAGWAARSSRSRGREHPEVFKDDRPAFERDRDRVIHSAAFRRLEYKTQVFVNHEGDYYRTRLTHSLEVAQIARGLARRLGLNEDLAEALALAHDLGHTPFGHTGEEVLDRLMADQGGFEHNRQGLRVVTLLEERYPGFSGLNLTWEVREGIVKHSSSWDAPSVRDLEEYRPDLQPTLEAQLIDLADEIAYNNHDIDDGLEAGYVGLAELGELRLWRLAWDRVQSKHPGLDGRRAVYQTISHLIGVMMNDLVEATEARLRERGIETLDDVRRAEGRLVTRSDEMADQNRELKEFLHGRLYRHPKVEAMRFKAERFLTDLFNAYVGHPGLLSAPARRLVEAQGAKRTVCDLIAGMTDRSCLDEYRRLFDPYERV